MHTQVSVEFFVWSFAILYSILSSYIILYYTMKSVVLGAPLGFCWGGSRNRNCHLDRGCRAADMRMKTAIQQGLLMGLIVLLVNILVMKTRIRIGIRTE